MSDQTVDLSVSLAQLYERDFAEWVAQTVQLLRGHRFAEVDLEHLVEEIESLSKRDKRELQSRLIVLFAHLLKYAYQSEKRSPSWIATIIEQQRQILLILEESPSLRTYFGEIFSDCYIKARKDAARETGLAIATFPEASPFNPTQVLDEDWLPD